MATIFTPNLNIPKIDGSDHAAKESINRSFDRIDAAALPTAHAAEKAHFEMWRPGTTYAKQDAVRTSTSPSWGIYICTTSGTSGTAEPAGFGEGDIVSDGAAVWILQKLGGAGGSGGVDFWVTGRYYEKTVLALYRRLLYRCLADHTAGTTFTPAKWGMINVGYLPDWESAQQYEKNMLVLEHGCIYRCLAYHTAGLSIAADAAKWEIVVSRGARIFDWKSGAGYAQCETILYNDCLYRAKTAHTAGASFTADAAKWEIIAQRKTLIPDWQPGTEYILNECILQDGHMYRALLPHISGASFAADMTKWELVDMPYLPNWQANTAYKKDEMVFAQDMMYRARRAHVSGVLFVIADWEVIGGAGVTVWQAGAPYAIGQVVLRNGVLYVKKI